MTVPQSQRCLCLWLFCPTPLARPVSASSELFSPADSIPEDSALSRTFYPPYQRPGFRGSSGARVDNGSGHGVGKCVVRFPWKCHGEAAGGGRDAEPFLSLQPQFLSLWHAHRASVIMRSHPRVPDLWARCPGCRGASRSKHTSSAGPSTRWGHSRHIAIV